MRTLILLIALVVVSFMSVRCTKPEPTKPVVASIPFTKLRWEGAHPDAANWTKHVNHVLPVLGKDMLAVTPEDYALFCPNFPQLTQEQKAHFYSQLLSVMVERESSFNPNTKYDESKTSKKLKGVISRGLLQISLKSSNSYGCGLKSDAEIHDPIKNLSCGITILNRWIGQRDKRLSGKIGADWRGGARYWAVMRDLVKKDKHGKVVENSYSKIRKYTSALPICK